MAKGVKKGANGLQKILTMATMAGIAYNSLSKEDKQALQQKGKQLLDRFLKKDTSKPLVDVIEAEDINDNDLNTPL
ncbi:hypothetical protein [Streptococcus ovuberis]|uniref:Uncharacterized protein n=1 Tax=Streptococcus ovuberis TaxID=1936207 RepID=A0A7X6S1Z4_9STRE|nr:hypothetical protein [Streptococcus ovuberis]NKZ20686.1 hypothetical protein [Streptococcus ovuberis]